jgi:nicotinic acid phosphoribosyltransferase
MLNLGLAYLLSEGFDQSRLVKNDLLLVFLLLVALMEVFSFLRIDELLIDYICRYRLDIQSVTYYLSSTQLCLSARHFVFYYQTAFTAYVSLHQVQFLFPSLAICSLGVVGQESLVQSRGPIEQAQYLKTCLEFRLRKKTLVAQYTKRLTALARDKGLCWRGSTLLVRTRCDCGRI